MTPEEKKCLTEHIESMQSRLDIPECFQLSHGKLRSEETIGLLAEKLYGFELNIGDKYAILEIIKQWLNTQDV